MKVEKIAKGVEVSGDGIFVVDADGYHVPIIWRQQSFWNKRLAKHDRVSGDIKGIKDRR